MLIRGGGELVLGFNDDASSDFVLSSHSISVIRDSKTELPSDTIREYLNDASDITRPLVRERIAITTEVGCSLFFVSHC